MKVIAKKNRELALINAQNTQNENRAETITLVVPEEYEDYNKKIVFITDDRTVWDVITNNEYKITNAITKYKQVDFYIWLTKEVDGESIDFRTKTKTLNFYHNEDASDEITDEEIHGVNTVVNLLEEEIEKVENLNIEATKIGDTTTVTITKKDGTTESVDINDGIDGKDGEDGKDAKINGKNSIEIEAGNNITIDNTETGIRINSTNDGGTTDYTDLENKPKINNVELSGNKSLNDLGIQPKGNYIEDNNYVHTDNNFNNTYKNKLEGLENYDDTEVKEDIADIQDEQTEQNTEIEKLQEENARLKATLPTTTGEGKEVTLNKTAELEFIKPPLPMGNSEQVQYSGKNLFDKLLSTLKTGGVTLSNDLLSCVVDFTYSNDEYFGICTIESPTTKTYTLSFQANGIKSGETPRYNVYSGQEPKILKNGLNIINIPNGSSIPNNRLLFDDQSKTQYPNTSTVTFTNFMLVEGEYTETTMPDYEPYTGGTASPNPDYPQEITNVTGDVEVKVQNKNLFDINSFESQLVPGKIINDNGVEVSDATSTYSRYKLFLRKNVTYYIKGAWQKIYYYDMNGNLKSRSSAFNGADRSYTPSENEYIGFQIGNTYWSSNKGQEQIEQNSTSTNFVEHKEQTFPLALGNIELCKIGDYQDYFYKQSNKWYLHKEIAKKVLDGSENWTKSGAFTNSYFLYIPDSMNIQTTDINIYVYCNNYRRTYYSNILSYDYSCILSNNKNVMIHDNSIDNVEDFKTWLSTHNTIVYYVIATPTDTEITDTTLISQLEAINNAISYEEQTNISSNTIALFNVEAYQDAKVILAEKGTYSKPSTGIPKTDLASDVQTSLGKADTALQSHQDISGKANKISVVQTSTSTIEINSNTFYKFGEVASLNITLASITDNTIYNEYMFEFVSGTTATTLTLPSSIKWLETPTIDANKIYQCSIVDNVGLLVGVANV